jgi:hypothetical protein
MNHPAFASLAVWQLKLENLVFLWKKNYYFVDNATFMTNNFTFGTTFYR